MPQPRLCLGCRRTIPSGSRCPDCEIPRQGNTAAKRALHAEILRRDANTCYLCGKPANTVDHVIPLARGGTDNPANLAASCGPCNSGKRNR